MDQETAEFLSRIVSIVSRIHTATSACSDNSYSDDNRLSHDIADVERDIVELNAKTD